VIARRLMGSGRVGESLGHSEAGPDANAVYAVGANAGESARLLRQADELLPLSQELLELVGLRVGDAVVDLGCGPRGCLELLAGWVTPAGRVVGVEANPAHVAMAAEFAARRGLSHVEIMRGDARHTRLPSASFNGVHARNLLVSVPDPAEVVGEMARLVAPGGWVACVEPDTEYCLCYPPHPAYERLCEIFTVVFSRNGADPKIGRRVPELLRRAGFEDVGVAARVQMYPPGNSKRAVRLDLVQSMRAQVVEMGLASEAELDKLDAVARAHLDNPRTVAIVGHQFLAWGRRA
jgi:SAM-dependent methyltransferase